MAKTITHERLTFKLLITGGREFKDREGAFALLDRAHAKFKITHLIHGDARGADRIAAEWAVSRGVQVVACPANWEHYKNAAGPIRNQYMIELCPDAVLAFPGGKGTKNMVEQAARHNVTVYDAVKLGLNKA